MFNDIYSLVGIPGRKRTAVEVFDNRISFLITGTSMLIKGKHNHIVKFYIQYDILKFQK